MKRVKITILVALLYALGCRCTWAQSDEANITARLKDKSLFLRDFWRGDKFRFDITGKPEKDYVKQSFTLSGFEMSKVKLKSDQLHIDGSRVGLEFDQNGLMHRVKLGRVSIDIDGNGLSDFSKALDAIFASSLQEIVSSLPAIWQPFAQYLSDPAGVRIPPLNERIAAAKKSGSTSSAQVTHAVGAVQAPKLLKSVEPEFTEDSRQAPHFNKDVQVYLWVEVSGEPSHIRVIRPIGLGLDEQAVYAVQQYRFKPAMQDGKPVKVDLYINVNFQTF